MEWQPFYRRALSTFADETITRVRETEGGTWYAVIDWPPVPYYVGLDFSTGARTRDEAVQRCADKIRRAHRGALKYQYSDIEPGYVLHWVLMKHWASKEAQQGGWG